MQKESWGIRQSIEHDKNLNIMLKRSYTLCKSNSHLSNTSGNGSRVNYIIWRDDKMYDDKFRQWPQRLVHLQLQIKHSRYISTNKSRTGFEHPLMYDIKGHSQWT